MQSAASKASSMSTIGSTSVLVMPWSWCRLPWCTCYIHFKSDSPLRQIFLSRLRLALPSFSSSLSRLPSVSLLPQSLLLDVRSNTVIPGVRWGMLSSSQALLPAAETGTWSSAALQLATCVLSSACRRGATQSVYHRLSFLWSHYRKYLPGQFIRLRLKIEQNSRLFLDILSGAIMNILMMTFTSRLKMGAERAN